jgi:zinc protease
VESGVTDREISFIKRYVTRSWAFEIDTAQKRVHQALDIELLGLPRDYYEKYLAHVADVTSESANAALKAHLDPKNLIIAVVGTAGTTLEGVKKAIPDLASDEVVAYDVEAEPRRAET